MGERTGYPVVDADGHVIERPDLWAEYVEPEYRDRAPRFVREERGGMAQRIGDGLTGRLAVEMRERSQVGIEGVARRTGGWDPKVRLEDMDAEGIDVAMLFPSMSFFVCEVADPGLDAALCRAYNDWLADYCKTARDRLYGIPLARMRRA